jgi:hypothetical protein
MSENAYDLTPGLDAYGHLWIAVLRQAIDDATIEPATSEMLVERRRARLWIRERADYIGSLQWICDVLNIDAAKIIEEFESRTQGGGMHKRRRAVVFAYHKRKTA